MNFKIKSLVLLAVTSSPLAMAAGGPRPAAVPGLSCKATYPNFNGSTTCEGPQVVYKGKYRYLTRYSSGVAVCNALGFSKTKRASIERKEFGFVEDNSYVYGGFYKRQTVVGIDVRYQITAGDQMDYIGAITCSPRK